MLLAPVRFGTHFCERIQSDIMGAEYGIGSEFIHEPGEPWPGFAREHAFYLAQAARYLRVIRLSKEHAPNLGSVFNQLDVAIGVDLAMDRGEKLDQIEFFYRILRPRNAPNFFQRGGRGQMARAGCGRSNENSHNPSIVLQSQECPSGTAVGSKELSGGNSVRDSNRTAHGPPCDVECAR